MMSETPSRDLGRRVTAGAGITHIGAAGELMRGVVYLVNGDQLIAMERSLYDAEDILQRLLAADARLLGGAASGEASARRWILIRREALVRGASGQQWSADHLFVDDEAVPTVVEVKRSTNTQLRREVVGQLLEYVANLRASTSADELRSAYEEAVLARAEDPEVSLQQALGVTMSADEYWAAVGENLARGRIRGFIVADEIPEELRRIIEYLNDQLGDSRFLALEVPQFKAADGVTTLVPQIVAGSLEPPIQQPASRPSAQWNADRLIAAIEEKGETGAGGAARSLLRWAAEQHLGIRFGRGSEWGTATLFVPLPGEPRVATIWVPGTLGWHFGAYRAPFDSVERRRELLAKIAAIDGIRWTTGSPPAAPERYPAVYLAPFDAPGPLRQLTDVLDWLVSETRRASGASPGTHDPVRTRPG